MLAGMTETKKPAQPRLNGFICRWKKLDRRFESFSRNKANRFGGLDLNFCASFWIHSSAGFTIADFKSSEADELNGFGFFDAEFNAVNHCVQSALCICFAGTEGFLDCYGEFNFIHDFVWVLELGLE